MKKYRVRIEVLSYRDFETYAENEEQACTQVEEAWDAGELKVTEDDQVECEAVEVEEVEGDCNE